MVMNAAQFAIVLENAIVPRAGRLPADVDMLLSLAVLAHSPVKSAARRNREDHIAALIVNTLADADYGF